MDDDTSPRLMAFARDCPCCGTTPTPGALECRLCGESLVVGAVAAAGARPGSGAASAGAAYSPPTHSSYSPDPYVFRARAEPPAPLPPKPTPARPPEMLPGAFVSPPKHGRPAWVVPVGAVAAVLVVMGVAVAVAHNGSGTSAGESSPSVTPPSSPSSATSTTPTPEPTTPTPTPSPTPDANMLAGQQLEAARQTYLDDLDLDGRWVAQLSSKSAGIKDPLQRAADGSHTFRLTDILSEYQADESNSNFSGLLLLKSTDFGKQGKSGTLWVVLDDEGFASSAEVHQWCRQMYPGRTGSRLADLCVPRTLSEPHD